MSGQVSDVSVYKKNRDILYNALTEYGYRCIKPDGAFYLFVESLEKDAAAFSEKAKEFDTLQDGAAAAAKRGYVDNVISGSEIRKHLIYALQMFGMR